MTFVVSATMAVTVRFFTLAGFISLVEKLDAMLCSGFTIRFY